MGHSEGSTEREVLKKTENSQINNLTLHLKELEKQQRPE